MPSHADNCGCDGCLRLAALPTEQPSTRREPTVVHGGGAGQPVEPPSNEGRMARDFNAQWLSQWDGYLAANPEPLDDDFDAVDDDYDRQEELRHYAELDAAATQDLVARMADELANPEPTAPFDPQQGLEILDAPADCGLCGTNSDMYAVDGRLVCLECYENEIQRLYYCAGCREHVSPGEEYNYGNERYCYTCIRQRRDVCEQCGTIRDRGTMRRDNRDRPTCSGCYKPEWKAGEWTTTRNTYARASRGFTYGVEIETSRSEHFGEMEGETVWGCVPEASTSGREFISPVLWGDAGLQEIADFLRKWGDDWEVDGYCGTHIHIGLHRLSLEQKRRVAYAYFCAWPFLADVIGPDRANNSMCGSPQWTLQDLMSVEDTEDFAEARDRFEFVNWRSLLKYGTIEIRCLQGTLDPTLIINWICWHLKFIRKVSSMSMDKLQKTMNEAMEFCDSIDPDMMGIIRERIPARRSRRPRSLSERLRNAQN